MKNAFFFDKMSRMSGKKLSLEKGDLWIVFLAFILMSGLMFTLGVMIGYGLKPEAAHAPKENDHKSQVTHVGAGEHQVKSTHDRSPASIGKKEEDGSKLKQAFRKAKQQALNEMEEKQLASEPKSVQDVQAHLNVHDRWDRKPATQSAKQKAELRQEKLKEEQKERLAQGVPAKTSKLFERAPSSIDKFEPTFGQYTVQVASYSTQDEALSKVKALRSMRINDAYYEVYTMKNGDKWFRVAIGSYREADQARALGNKLVKQKSISDFVVRQVQ